MCGGKEGREAGAQLDDDGLTVLRTKFWWMGEVLKLLMGCKVKRGARGCLSERKTEGRRRPSILRCS